MVFGGFQIFFAFFSPFCLFLELFVIILIELVTVEDLVDYVPKGVQLAKLRVKCLVILLIGQSVDVHGSFPKVR